MTKARDIADFKFENITDTGTEGTRVATGTTAQRGSTAGQIRFNSETGLAEYYTGTAFKPIDSPPTITSVDTSLIDSNSGSTTSIVITGSNFQTGVVVTFVPNSGSNISPDTTTINNANQITVVVTDSNFVNANEPYDVKVENTSGLSSTLFDAINVDTTVAWQTASGSLGSVNDEATGTHFTVSATDADGDTITYSVQSGSLPAGMSLNSSTGAISGDPTDVSSSTISNFTLRASTPNANADRSFSITVTPAPYNIDYLVIAGGGGGGESYGGGGGAGGYRTSWNNETSGGNSSSETALNLNAGTVLTVSVGGGGSIATYGNLANSGGSSSISGSGITTITSSGGGGAGGNLTGGASGGSGGGGGSGGSGGGGSGTINQGFAGGSASSSGSGYSAGGGGGASSAGGNSPANSSTAGNGGNGLASTITGSAITRAGGGGGSSYLGSGSSGGSGGGGNGGDHDGSPSGSNATANTGSGGGGGGGAGGGSNYGNGASGVVILRMPTSAYSGITTGSPTVTTSGLDTILTFNASGSYTS